MLGPVCIARDKQHICSTRRTRKRRNFGLPFWTEFLGGQALPPTARRKTTIRLFKAANFIREARPLPLGFHDFTRWRTDSEVLGGFSKVFHAVWKWIERRGQCWSVQKSAGSLVSGLWSLERSSNDEKEEIGTLLGHRFAWTLERVIRKGRNRLEVTMCNLTMKQPVDRSTGALTLETATGERSLTMSHKSDITVTVNGEMKLERAPFIDPDIERERQGKTNMLQDRFCVCKSKSAGILLIDLSVQASLRTVQNGLVIVLTMQDPIALELSLYSRRWTSRNVAQISSAITYWGGGTQVVGLVVQVSVGTGLRKHGKRGQCRTMSMRVACSAAIRPFEATNFIQMGHCRYRFVTSRDGKMIVRSVWRLVLGSSGVSKFHFDSSLSAWALEGSGNVLCAAWRYDGAARVNLLQIASPHKTRVSSLSDYCRLDLLLPENKRGLVALSTNLPMTEKHYRLNPDTDSKPRG
ncbi:hypothetical protein EDD17DRAFT_1507400 [Pisolithus thermaeus]|nr:hypothetical protein EDD17DRAFT_1507400 [Pisolithus thermaeus]